MRNRFFPDTEVLWRDVGIGAGMTTLLFAIRKVLMGLHLTQSSLGLAYGSTGLLVIFLGWVYYASLVFLFGAECAAVYTSDRGPSATGDSHCYRRR